MNKQNNINNLQFSYSIDSFKFNKKYPYLIFECGLYNDSITDLHKHNFFEIGICKKGTGLFLIENKIYSYKPGDIILIDRNLYHRAQSNDKDEDLWAFCYINFEKWTGKSISSNSHIVTNKFIDKELYSIINITINEFQNKNDYFENVIDGLIISIFHSIKRRMDNSNIINLDLQLPPKLDLRINKAITLMLKNEYFSYSIRKIAAECNLSTSHFRQLFKKQIGYSPKEYQTQIRIKKAMSLLLTNNDKMINIAYTCGFESLTSFNRQFKNQTGTTPLQWKEEMKR